ncbi:MAG: glycosyltransferase family 2 protein [Candidatus Omnitrophica bacterium]|nr:glycosyltransferase family 2 protein [Candidatus Omnitrophota bacterium]
MPDISAVIPTFNCKDFIKSCLDSVFVQGYQNIEVIVVDNGSQDGTVNFIRENYPEVILLQNLQNLGACKARNQGIERSSGCWILTLDCDIILQKDFLSKIVKIIENLPSNIGMIQPKILYPDKKTIYSTGIYLSHLRRFYDIGKGKDDNGQFNTLRHIFGACSAAALYRRDMLEELKEATGYFDERFFFLVEDVDLSWRAQRRGWESLYYPKAICYHYGNSSRINKKLRQYLCFRNRLYSIMKNEKLLHYFLKIYPMFLYDFPHLIYLAITNKYIFNKNLPEIKN